MKAFISTSFVININFSGWPRPARSKLLFTMIPIILGHLYALPCTGAETSQSGIESVVRTVKIRLVEDNKEKAVLRGRLYRRSFTVPDKQIALVDENGLLDQVYRCNEGDRILALPMGRFYSGDRAYLPCRDNATFDYQEARTFAIRSFDGSEALDVSTYLRAYSDIAKIYTVAALDATGEERSIYEERARVIQTAIIAGTAHMLGDENLDRLVVRDPSRGNRLAFNANGVAALKTLQKANGISVTGRADFATLKVVGQMEVPSSLRTPSGALLVLPEQIFDAKVIRGAEHKSSDLIAVEALLNHKNDR